MKKRELAESSILRGLVFLVDVLCLTFCVLITFEILRVFSPFNVGDVDAKNYIILGVLCYIPTYIFFPPIFLGRTSRVEHVVANVAMTTVCFMGLFVFSLYMLKNDALTRTYMSTFYITFILLLEMSRLSMRYLIIRKRRGGRNQTSVLMVGRVEEMSDLYDDLSQRDYGLIVEGLFTDDLPEALPEKLSYLGPVKAVQAYLRQHDYITSVYCSMAAMGKLDAIELYRYCENNMIRFYTLPVYVNFLRRNMVVTQVGSSVMLSPRQEPLRDVGNRMIKRTFDVIGSLLFLLTLFPFLYVFVAFIVKQQSKGPVLFVQKRRGLNGKIFKSIKFRSMHVQPEEGVLPLEDESRFFPFGRFLQRTNIDELPQFINVLKGDMSIVGPRPHMLIQAEEYSQMVNHYMVRCLVKPGITGWAQIQERYIGTRRLKAMEERVRADIWYIENWTFWLDVRILLKTIWMCACRII